MSMSPGGRGSPGVTHEEGFSDAASSTVRRSTGFVKDLRLMKSPGKRLPREGPSPGGGKVAILNRTSFEATVSGFTPDDDAEQPPAGLGGTSRRNSTKHGNAGGSPERGGDSATGSVGKSDRKSPGKDGPGYASSSAGTSSHPTELDREKEKRPNRTLSQAERKRVEIGMKWAKVDAQREKQQQIISEKVEKGKEMREARFKRMLEEVMGRGELGFSTAMQLRELEAKEERKKRDHYNTWNEKVFQPIASQAFEHLNPPDRLEQQALTGTKSVSFNVPGKTFRLYSNVSEDPVRKPLLQTAAENAFHAAATSFLHGPKLATSASAPELRHPSVLRISGNGQSGSTPVLPRATTKPTLEPMEWGQIQLQGSMFGKFAQNCEYGPGFRRMKRGEAGVFIPREDDGVPACGKRSVRDQDSSFRVLHGDVGILAGDIASRGETTQHKYPDGGSSGAPNQDHFNYRTGQQVTDIEFPLGKKVFPQFH
eukprot:gnl/TRDRNA2_/TRDRNA2_185906_c0_seq1.p1 gnl/TRDRNA2_/TRDRNA2_185906_c0~~gnl/TRDRNA2_/TRDRNA2_185906_c0_seq1.p1  ORF type:complete len:482 (+),score=91.88 gnl/TRDRNA2_/TRDRNA2_185906_c0_seq1:143-1588(+)